MQSDVLTLKEDFGSKPQSLLEDVAVLKKAISQGVSLAMDGPSKIKVP